jgi:hypothetical protein
MHHPREHSVDHQARISLAAFTRFIFRLTALLPFILWAQASLACSVHEHGCVFHGVGRPVIQGVSGQISPTSLTIYSVGVSTSGAVNKTDYDNVVLLPNGKGPYVVSVSGTDGFRGDQPYISAQERPRAVSSNYYSIAFSGNTAIATHSGDFNGGEPLQAGMTGCPGAASPQGCEIVSITGNVPTGTYKQKTHLYNFFNLANPSATVSSYAVATGKGVVVNQSHLNGTVVNGSSEYILVGQGATTPEYSYEFLNTGYDPHATGVALMHSRSSTRKNLGTRTIQDDHTRQTFRDTQYSFYDKQNQIKGNGDVDVLSEKLISRHTNSALVSTEKLITQHQRCVAPSICPVVGLTNNLPYTADFTGARIVDDKNSSFKQIIPITTYKDEWNIFGTLRVIDKTEWITVNDKSEAKRLLELERIKGAEASGAAEGVIRRGDITFQAIDLASNLPVVGQGLSLGSAISGISTSGEEMGVGERIFTLTGVLPGGKNVKGAGTVIVNLGETITEKAAKEFAEKQSKEVAERLAINIANQAKELSDKAMKEALIESANSKKLKNILKDIYKGSDNPLRVGDGTLMDAIKEEIKTGVLVHGRDHAGQKTSDIIKGLEKIVRGNNYNQSDKDMAKEFITILNEALKY